MYFSFGSVGRRSAAIADFNDNVKGHLRFRLGEVIDVLEEATSGWWPARNRNGFKGLAPGTYLKRL